MTLTSDSICPRCGSPMEWHAEEEGVSPGVSLTDGVTYICSPCWAEEQIDKRFADHLVPQSEWFTTVMEPDNG